MMANSLNTSFQPILPQPFLKWPGGKRRLVSQIRAAMPDEFGTYFEPFIGGGAVFFDHVPPGAFISDFNPEVANVYNVVKHKVWELMSDLRRHPIDKKYYYRLRNADRSPDFQQWDAVKRASRFIYLNKTTFNGHVRVNSRGFANNAFGHPQPKSLFDADNLLACHHALRQTRIWQGCFTMVENLPKGGDFVYFDPPYVPKTNALSPRAAVEYTHVNFGSDMQLKLKELCDRLDKRGVRFMVSNTACPFIDELYGNYRVQRVNIRHVFSAKGSQRNMTQEALVTNY
ncbi:Dam family site-specific DNA-(adenine-N6)-methyltransferase [Magnetovibrio sp. PR-2]|uniref:DNA adenine methylase n=1 Tax=Magnetovibrio sp. PR-2 TaxID=3120356 RepID=UPI002FCDFBA2